MKDGRPSPEQILQRIKKKDDKRGKLKIFFGACAGAGKTYDMLSAAQQEIQDHQDVWAGIIETHGRVETGKLLEGIPKLPLKSTSYQGITVHEFDLDEALKQKPDILLVDELAHTNIKGARHPKRWQDIQEILDAGIDVYTTLNVQHLESLNDTVANVTGVRVKETVPDSVFDNADEIVLVDVPSEVILERLEEGKVYLGEFAKQRASQHFFKLENLIVLRELALRRTAERVDALRDIYQKYHTGTKRSSLSDKILVCINAKPVATKLVRTAKQQATKLKCPWTVLYIEDENHYYLSNEEKNAIEKTLRLAEQMGGTTTVLQHSNVMHAILQFCKENNITRIIVGKPSQSHWSKRFSRSLANRLVDASEVLDLLVISDNLPFSRNGKKLIVSHSWTGYLIALFVIALCTLITLPIRDWLEPENVIMIYLAGLVFISVVEDRSVALFAALLSVICYSLFFTQPYLQFSISTHYTRDSITLLVFTLIALVITHFTSKLRLQSLSAKKRAKYTQDLYALSRKLLNIPGKHRIAKVVSEHIGEAFESAVTVWVPDNAGKLLLASHPGIKTEIKEESVALWTFAHNQAAGAGTNTMPSARGYYLPLSNEKTVFGVMGIIPKDPSHAFRAEEILTLEALALQATLALERVKENTKSPKS